MNFSNAQRMWDDINPTVYVVSIQNRVVLVNKTLLSCSTNCRQMLRTSVLKENNVIGPMVLSRMQIYFLIISIWVETCPILGECDEKSELAIWWKTCQESQVLNLQD